MVIPGGVAVGVTAPRDRPRVAGTDAAVLAATLRLLARHGYRGTSLDAVAAEAGVSKPTVQRRWSSKADLVTAAVVALHAADPPGRSGDLRSDLAAHLRAFRRTLARVHGMSLVGALLTEEHDNPGLLELYRRRLVAPRRESLRQLLQAAGDRGELRDGADLDAAVVLLVGSVYAHEIGGGRYPRTWPAGVVDTVLAGLVRPPGRRP